MEIKKFCVLLTKAHWFLERIRSELEEDFFCECHFASPQSSLMAYAPLLEGEDALLTTPTNFSDEENDGAYLRMEKVRRFLSDTYSSKLASFWYSIPKPKVLNLIHARLISIDGLTWLSTHEHSFNHFPDEVII